MNILKELKKAWKNAAGAKEEKPTDGSLDKLKEEIEGGAKSEAERPVLPESAKYEKAEYTPKTDEQLETAAKNTLAEYERAALAAIASQSEAEKDKLEKSRGKADADAERKFAEIENAYGDAKRNLDGDVLKRGLAHSSIAVARSADLQQSKADTLLAAKNDYDALINEIADALLSLDGKKQTATDELMKELANKTAAKVEELRAKDEAAMLDTLKYNNSLEEKSAKEERDRLELEQRLYGEMLDNEKKRQELDGSKSSQESVYAGNYNKMDELLSKMNRSDAARLIKDDPFFRANLSEYLYYKLYTKYAG